MRLRRNVMSVMTVVVFGGDDNLINQKVARLGQD